MLSIQEITRGLGFLLTVLCAEAVFAGDWPQWGGRDCRTMVSTETGLPDSFTPRKISSGDSLIDPAADDNLKWTARLGSAAYGNPTVAGGKVYVGTDTLTLRDDPRRERHHKGLVKCFDEATGTLLWQLIVPNRSHGLPDEVHYGLQNLGVCSSPNVDGDRVYVVSSAGDILCLDANGLADGNDGAFLDEAQYIAGHGNPPVELNEHDADILWRFDPIDELDVCPHDAASCSILIHGDILYVGTSNGVGGPKGSNWIAMHSFVVRPEAPALIALDKHNGQLVATENAGISRRIYHAQWSSPSLGKVGDRTLIFFGGGDGWCYAFEAIAKAEKQPVPLKLVWSYDCNPPEFRYRDGKPIPYYDGDKRHNNSPNKDDGTYVGPSQVIATPAFENDRVYVAIGQDPAHGRGRGMLHCIDATLEGDITETGRLWAYDGIERTMATTAVANGLVYVPDLAGTLYCLDAENGKCRWTYDTKAETWGGVLVADGKLFLVNKKYFFAFAAGSELQLLNRILLGSPAYSTPVAANGVLFLASRGYLWAVRQEQ